MTSAPSLTMRARIGYRYRLTLTIPSEGMRQGALVAPQAAWWPRVPSRLSPQEIADYRSARDRFVSELAAIVGGAALIAEPGTGLITVVEPASAGPGKPS